jgi:hypothetical protein
MAHATAQPRSGDKLFEACGSLTLSTFDKIRERLRRAGCRNTREQSHLLARQLDCHDPTPLWALLMWNTPPALPLRDGLARWIELGMPIPATARTRETAA